MSADFGADRGTVAGNAKNAPSDESDKAISHNDFESSRGGTRTRDPGIMSAVL